MFQKIMAPHEHVKSKVTGNIKPFTNTKFKVYFSFQIEEKVSKAYKRNICECEDSLVHKWKDHEVARKISDKGKRLGTVSTTLCTCVGT